MIVLSFFVNKQGKKTAFKKRKNPVICFLIRDIAETKWSQITEIKFSEKRYPRYANKKEGNMVILISHA